MTDILQTIIAHKLTEVEALRAALPVNGSLPADTHTPRPSLRTALLASPTGIIAEFKRRSPSKGWINEAARPDIVPLGYQQAGAAALSILTDEHFFGGQDHFITEARRSGVTLPILYKNFIIDRLQLYQAARCGASAVLLIAACLSHGACEALISEAHGIGLEVLLEIHSESELEYADLPADCIGVNNRNLGSFVTDVRNSFRLAEKLRDASPSAVLVSESGISNPDTVRSLRQAGFRGFLIGETFMKTADPAAALNQFITLIHS